MESSTANASSLGFSRGLRVAVGYAISLHICVFLDKVVLANDSEPRKDMHCLNISNIRRIELFSSNLVNAAKRKRIYVQYDLNTKFGFTKFDIDFLYFESLIRKIDLSA